MNNFQRNPYLPQPRSVVDSFLFLGILHVACILSGHALKTLELQWQLFRHSRRNNFHYHFAIPFVIYRDSFPLTKCFSLWVHSFTFSMFVVFSSMNLSAFSGTFTPHFLKPGYIKQDSDALYINNNFLIWTWLIIYLLAVFDRKMPDICLWILTHKLGIKVFQVVC